MDATVTHEPTASPAENDRVIFLSGVVFVVILVIMLLCLRSYFFVVRNETIDENYLSAGNPEIEEVHAREKALLTSYGWVNKEKGIVRIPIDQAMELMVREAQSGTPGAPSGGRR
jgi:hypothetical protein